MNGDKVVKINDFDCESNLFCSCVAGLKLQHPGAVVMECELVGGSCDRYEDSPDEYGVELEIATTERPDLSVLRHGKARGRSKGTLIFIPEVSP